MPTLNRQYEGVANQATFYTPAKDKRGLHAESKTSDENLPRVFIIGDSISVGYTQDVIHSLQNRAFVTRAKANCGDTNRGLDATGHLAWGYQVGFDPLQLGACMIFATATQR